MRRESSKYFTDKYPLGFKCLKGEDMTLVNSRTAGAIPLGSVLKIMFFQYIC